MRQYKIALIGGDGIGPDVVEAGRQVLDALADTDDSFRFDFESFNWGSLTPARVR